MTKMAPPMTDISIQLKTGPSACKHQFTVTLLTIGNVPLELRASRCTVCRRDVELSGDFVQAIPVSVMRGARP
jgi:hypothetical protein